MNRLLVAISVLFAAQRAFGQVAVWGQCGGIGYSGSTTCASGSVCVESNSYYSQCQPGTATTAPATTAHTTAPTGTSSASGSSATIPAGYSQITNFGSNPTNVGMFVYKPQKLASPPPLILALHYCQGTAEAYYEGTTYAQLAETYGYYVLYGNAPTAGGCWDVASTATLTHNGGGDSLGLASAVRYAIANWGVNADRVFVTGTSSGAMMTSVMAGAYPDLFQAGAVDSGVAFGCFAGPNAWNSECADGDLIQTPEQWGDEVRAAYPGYTGARPKMQIWHGTIDTTLYPQNFWEEIKQWTNVFGYSQTPISNVSMVGYPAGYSNATYGPEFQAILAQNVGHTVPVYEDAILTFFGIE